ncbi:IS3 family transposase [Streptomyces sp. NPDC002159]
MPAPKKYPSELRERAVRMYRSAEPKPVIRRLAEDLGVHPEALRAWIRKDEAGGELGDRLTTAEREEHTALRKENVQLRRANEVLPTASAFFRGAARPDPAQVTALVEEHPHLGVEPVLRELHIPASTYYHWCRMRKQPCERRPRDIELTERIRKFHEDSDGIYDSPRVRAVLKREGCRVGRKRVERLMRQAGLAGISPRKNRGFTRRDPDDDPAPDLVKRNFTVAAPNRLWVTDLTMVPTTEGPLWLSAIRDAFSRRVVAWETSARADADLVLTTFESALASREVTPGELVHYADHGCQGEFN